MSWRAARGLWKLRDQVNEKYPQRSRKADGFIGDAAHRSRASDHNPVAGVVHAWDCTHDVRNGCDVYALAEKLRISKDPRISYVITNRRIFSSTNSPFTWRKYTGSNGHTGHMHISIRRNPHADDTRGWKI